MEFTLTDAAARDLLPFVEEFVAEVARRDRDALDACLSVTEPRTMAVLLAELLIGEREAGQYEVDDAAVSAAVRLEREANDAAVRELRSQLQGARAAATAFRERALRAEVKVKELRGLLDEFGTRAARGKVA